MVLRMSNFEWAYWQRYAMIVIATALVVMVALIAFVVLVGPWVLNATQTMHGHGG